MADTVDALSALRRGTHDLHQRLEALPLFACLLSAAVSRDDYVRALSALQSLYAGLETELIHGLQQHAPDYPYFPRLPLLQQDLAQLGSAPALNPDLPPVPINGMAATLGTLYVIEGSILGGKLLKGHLHSRLGETVASALAFYGLDGHWDVTQALLRDNLRTLDAIGQAVAAARQAFLLFIDVAEDGAS